MEAATPFPIGARPHRRAMGELSTGGIVDVAVIRDQCDVADRNFKLRFHRVR